MRSYPCKKEISNEILKQKMQIIFGNVKEESGKFISSFPPLERIEVMLTDKKEISVETVSGNTGDPSMAVKVFNKFLEETTGYNAKERKKMAMKL